MAKKMSIEQRVKALATTKKGLITDKGFFEGRYFKKFAEDKVMALTKRYSAKEHVCVIVKEGICETAYTDHRNVVINWACEIFDGMSRPQRYLNILGILFHETAHILYTDNKYCQAVMDEIKNTGELPASTIPYDEELVQIVKEGKHTMQFLELWHSIFNIVEDGYIEYRFLDDYAGRMFYDALMALRNTHIATVGTWREMVDRAELDENGNRHEELMIYSITNLLLFYAKYDMLLHRTIREEDDERTQALMGCIPYVDAYNMSYNSDEHFAVLNDIISVLSPYIAKYIKTLPETDEIPKEMKDQIDELGKQGGSGQSQMLNNSSSSASGSQPQSPLAPTTGNPSPKNANNSENKEKAEKNNGKREIGAGAGSEDTDATDESIEEAAAAIERLLNQEATEIAESELEKEHERQLQKENQSFEYDQSIHAGVTCSIIRDDASETKRNAWEMIKPEVMKIVNQTTNGLKQILKDRKLGSVQRGLYFGRQINTASYTRSDKKYFQNKKLPTDEPTISVEVLIDESGSMYGQRIQSAMFMALVVYNACQELGIRVSILGHTSSCAHVQIRNYCDFGGCFDKKDLYRLMGITDRNCNRDGYALQYAVNRIKKETSTTKLLFIISDGEPADSCYSGTAAYTDMRNVVTNAHRNGIEVIAAAIGDDKDVIKEIYGEDRFMDISDLTKLPLAIVNKIKKYLPQQV